MNYYTSAKSVTATNAAITGTARNVLVHGMRLVAGSAAAAATVTILTTGTSTITLNLAAPIGTADSILLNHPLECNGDVNLSAISGTGASFTLIYSLA